MVNQFSSNKLSNNWYRLWNQFFSLSITSLLILFSPSLSPMINSFLLEVVIYLCFSIYSIKPICILPWPSSFVFYELIKSRPKTVFFFFLHFTKATTTICKWFSLLPEKEQSVSEHKTMKHLEIQISSSVSSELRNKFWKRMSDVCTKTLRARYNMKKQVAYCIHDILRMLHCMDRNKNKFHVLL